VVSLDLADTERHVPAAVADPAYARQRLLDALEDAGHDLPLAVADAAERGDLAAVDVLARVLWRRLPRPVRLAIAQWRNAEADR
jgi:hypothetical protein